MVSLRKIADLLKFVPGMKAVANLPGVCFVKNEVGAVIDGIDIQKLPDRKYFTDTIVPGVAILAPRKLLFVGCRNYSESYCKLWWDSGIDCWTIDIDPEAARWGVPGQHVVGDVLEVDRLFPADEFDAVIMNGVFGFGIETVDQIDRALHAVSNVMTEGGLLVVGWNTDKTIDTSTLASMGAHFHYSERIPFPRRKRFPTLTHVYDFYVKQT